MKRPIEPWDLVDFWVFKCSGAPLSKRNLPVAGIHMKLQNLGLSLFV